MAAVGVLGAIMIAIGLFVLYMMGQIKKFGSQAMWVSIVLGFGLIIGGGYMVGATVPPDLLKIKIVGLVLSVFGFFMAIYFPGFAGFPPRYQPAGMSRLGLLIGLVSLFAGIYLLIFY